METKQATRIQNSLTHPIEKKVLVWLAERQPAWVNSDLLTYTGTLGAFSFALGFCINEGMMFFGVGLSGMLHLSLALTALVLYLFMTINVSINAHLKGEFRLTYGKLGPTEFRLLVILFDTILILSPGIRAFVWYGLSALDLFAIVVIVALSVIYIATIVSDARHYALIDPLHKEPHDNIQS